MRMSVGLQECGARSNPYIAKVLEKCRKSGWVKKTWPLFDIMILRPKAATMLQNQDFAASAADPMKHVWNEGSNYAVKRTNNVFLRYTY